MEAIYFADFIRRKKEGKQSETIFITKGKVLPIIDFCAEFDLVVCQIKQVSQKKTSKLKGRLRRLEEDNALFIKYKNAEKLHEYICLYYSLIKKDSTITTTEKDYIFDLIEELQEDVLKLWEVCFSRKIYCIQKRL